MAENAKSLTIEEFDRLLAHPEALVVDTLPPEHYQLRHIPGAKQACVYEVTFLEQIAALGATPDTPIALYGAGPLSQDSFTAAEKLLRAGFRNLYVFEDGLEGWRASGRKLEGEAPDSEDPPHPVLTLDKERYSLLPAESSFIWRGRNNNGSHWGTLQVSEGHLQTSGNGLQGNFKLDMRTIHNVDLEGDELHPVLESHLKSDDFFFSSLFPTAEFSIKSMLPIEAAPATLPNYGVSGELALRGLKRPVDFNAQLRNVADGRLAFIAHMDVDRTKWGAIYGSARFFQHLSYHVVYDMISVEFRLVLE